MNSAIRVTACMLAAALAHGCVAPTAAPGAAEVVITHKAADVAGCTAAGNIGPKVMNGDPIVAQNAAVGLNANVILYTDPGGIAYRCGSKP